MKTLILALLAMLHVAHAVPETLPIISITIDSTRASPPTLLIAVWDDGSIVWSQDREDGGPPYLSAKIDPAKTAAFLAKLDQDGVFGREDLVRVGPDASYHEIHLLSGKKHVNLISWHELYERNPKIVSTSHGLTAITEGKTREQMLKEDKQEYREFRSLWKRIRDFTETLVPKKGLPYEGPLKFKYPR